MYENVIIYGETEEGKADSLVAYLNGEAFEYYFTNFAEDNALCRRTNHYRNEGRIIREFFYRLNRSRNDEGGSNHGAQEW